MKNLLNVLLVIVAILVSSVTVDAMDAECVDPANVQKEDPDVDWTCGKICVNGDTITVPCYYRELMELGYSCKDDTDVYLSSYERVEYTHKRADSVVYCTHANFTDEPARIADCPIICISVDDECNSSMDINGVGIGSNIAEFKDVLGEYWSFYNSADINFYRYRTVDCYELYLNCDKDGTVNAIDLYTTADLSNEHKQLNVRVLKDKIKVRAKNLRWILRS